MYWGVISRFLALTLHWCELKCGGMNVLRKGCKAGMGGRMRKNLIILLCKISIIITDLRSSLFLNPPSRQSVTFPPLSSVCTLAHSLTEGWSRAVILQP